MSERRVVALILAAGGSTRMGRSKALLPWRGVTMLRRIAGEALASRASGVLVVVGCEADAARRDLDALAPAPGEARLTVVENAAWEKGMGTSLAAGAAAARSESPPPDAVVVLLVDQPLVTAATIGRLIGAWESAGSPLVASRYGTDLGVPALFSSEFFEPLCSLSGDTGAREILRAYASRATILDLPEALADVDTPEEYEPLSQGD